MDVDAILRPLSGAFLCGEDMSFSPEFDAIIEARRFDDPLLGQGEWVTPLKEADWPAVVTHCSTLLETRSKDLRLVVWLVEGLARTTGIAGLAKGYDLLARLCQSYWSDIHPLPDDRDQSVRAGCLRWLLAQSPQIIRELPLAPTASLCAMLERIGAFDHVLERNPHQLAVRLSDLPQNPCDLDAITRGELVSLYREAMDFALEAIASLDQTRQTIEPHLGADGPGFEATRTALQDLIRALEQAVVEIVAQDRYDADVRNVRRELEGSSSHTDVAPLCDVGEGSTVSAIRNRADALALLRTVADYFRRTEPHSPVAYLADKAASWGEMSLHEWLQAVVKDGGALSSIEEALGVGAFGRGGGTGR